jgi:hypothetical protein
MTLRLNDRGEIECRAMITLILEDDMEAIGIHHNPVHV